MKLACPFLVLLSLSLAIPDSCDADPRSIDELTILDNDGSARATTKVLSGGNLLFVVTDSTGRLADQVQIYLTEKRNSRVLEATSDEGRAVFCNVPAGVWTVKSNVDWVKFDDVQVEARTPNSMLAADCGEFQQTVRYNEQVGLGAAGGAAGAILGVSIVGGATTAAVVGYNRRNDKSTPRVPLSPSR